VLVLYSLKICGYNQLRLSSENRLRNLHGLPEADKFGRKSGIA
jgi:hypothetical protein